MWEMDVRKCYRRVVVVIVQYAYALGAEERSEIVEQN